MAGTLLEGWRLRLRPVNLLRLLLSQPPSSNCLAALVDDVDYCLQHDGAGVVRSDESQSIYLAV
jgi:hypothetical protein